MDNLITLSCPSCGANVEVDSMTRHFSCKYCGGTHILSNPAVSIGANYVACPIDGHHDAVLKISVLIKAQTFDAPVDSSTEDRVMYQSQLAQKLLCPPKPGSPFGALTTRGGQVFLIFGTIFLTSLLAHLLISAIFRENSICSFILFFIIGSIVAAPLVRNLLTNNTLLSIFGKRNAEYQEKYRQWQNIRKRWELSYYCQRHDIAFINGSHQAIALDQFQSSLLQEEPSSKNHV